MYEFSYKLKFFIFVQKDESFLSYVTTHNGISEILLPEIFDEKKFDLISELNINFLIF